MMPIKKNDIIKLKIEDISNDGNGVGRYENMAIFIPYTSIGDELSVKIVKVAKTYAFGIVDNIKKPSSDRVEVDCVNYFKCGGCNFRHISYEAELKSKQKFVDDCITRIAKLDIKSDTILASPQENRYRNKVQYPLTVNEKGDIIYGFYKDRSHSIVPCKDCLLQPEHFSNILNDVCKMIQKLKIPIYNEHTHKGIIRHIYLRDGVRSGEVLLCVVINSNTLPNSKNFVNEITALYPNIKSIVLNVNKKQTNVITGLKCITIYNKNDIDDILCDVPVKLNPLSFYQVNTKGAEQLYNVAKDFAEVKKEDILLDLYCGMGTIGLSMAKEVKQLIGVEIIPEAIEAAKVSAKKMNLTNTKFIASDAGKATEKLLNENLKPTIIILDPPRKGCDETTLNCVIKMNPERIVMVSCNASTAARDIKYLSKNNYQVIKIKPVDMFPRTKHVETVVLMSRIK